MIELRKELAAQKKSECRHLTVELENVERQLYELEAAVFKDRELRLLARLIFTGTMLVKSDSHEILKRGRAAMNKTTFKSLEKKLKKKNAELIEVRDFRRKLDDKEKEICAEIEKLQNQKIETIFEEIKQEVSSTNNIDVSAAAILPILEALRNNQQTPEILSSEKNDSALVTTTEKPDENYRSHRKDLPKFYFSTLPAASVKFKQRTIPCKSESE